MDYWLPENLRLSAGKSYCHELHKSLEVKTNPQDSSDIPFTYLRTSPFHLKGFVKPMLTD